MKKRMTAIFAAAAMALAMSACCTSVPPEKMAGNFTVHKVFGSHMVLQRETPVTISGTAEPGKVVKATLAGKSVYAEADRNGEWKAVFPAMEAGGPYVLEVSGKDGKKEVFDDILFGEVWLCSGQSNMQMPVMGGQFWQVKNAQQEVKNGNHPTIRLFAVPLTRSPGYIQKETKGNWTLCTPETVRKFSAAGYFFGRQLNRDLNVPIGLINASWGGTRIEPWISEAAYIAAGRNEANLVKAARTPSREQEQKLKKAQAEYQVKFNKWIKAFHSTNPAATAKANEWKNPSCDDSKWAKAVLPGGIPTDVDGIGWFRHSVNLPADWAGKDLLLNLGAVDDCDETFFNGTKVGETGPDTEGYWAKKRCYLVPGKLVKAGRNVIAVRVADHFSNGGLMGGEKERFVTLKQGKAARIALPDSGWKFKLEFAADMKKLGPRPSTPAMLSGGVNSPSYPSTLFNSMIAPWTRYPVRGVIWYQGCSNAGSADYYPLHKILINDWRTQWKNPEMPFLLVQLAGFESHTPKKRLADDYWTRKAPQDRVPYALTREIQAEMLKLPNTGMAVAMDIGDHSDIHPADKQTVGYRLAMEAERIAYHSGKVSQGPLFKSMKIENGKIRLFFTNVGKGLATKDGKKPGAFAIAGKDGKYVWADAVIDGDTVVVSSPKVKDPRNVRYAWVQYRGDVNLCNKDGFAASPFRTDKPQYK